MVVTAGDGVVQAVPDRAWIGVTAESRAANPRDAQRKNADAMKPVQDRLRAAGIPEDAIKTTVYDLQPDWDYSNNRRVLRGYVARNTIDVRVDDIDRVGELLEMVVTAGATAVDNIRFDLKDREARTRSAAAGGRGCARPCDRGGRRRGARGRSGASDRGTGCKLTAAEAPVPGGRCRRAGGAADPGRGNGDPRARHADVDTEMMPVDYTRPGGCSRGAIRFCAI